MLLPTSRRRPLVGSGGLCCGRMERDINDQRHPVRAKRCPSRFHGALAWPVRDTLRPPPEVQSGAIEDSGAKHSRQRAPARMLRRARMWKSPAHARLRPQPQSAADRQANIQACVGHACRLGRCLVDSSMSAPSNVLGCHFIYSIRHNLRLAGSRQPAGARCPLLGPWRILQFARERLPGRFRPPVGRLHVALAQFEGFLALRLLAGVVPASHISPHPQFCIAELVSPLRVGPVPRRRRDRSLRRSRQIRKLLSDFYPPYLDAMARERARYPIT